MKEPTGKTWCISFGVTLVFTLFLGRLFGQVFGVRQWFDSIGSSAAFATVSWLFALTRWHRANSRM